MITKFLSYFFPITIKKTNSKINNQLEVTWHKGELNLDSTNTNYSYGNLEKVLRDGLKFIGSHKIKEMNHILVLGLGAGSIVDTLRNYINYQENIISVEIDPIVIHLGKKYFNLKKLTHKHTIVEMDAFEYVLRSQETFDLIVIDIFQDYTMPSFLFEDYFVSHLKELLSVNGFILFNTIILDEHHRKRNNAFLQMFEKEMYSTRIYPKSQTHNELITIKKLR
ncbi:MULTISPECIES: spermidine synthase [Myroides]|uniref:Spermidine synthase n=1 Tax=Myroides albus TaxID=2562892 RepID=A0A6I3LH44_9FLAO|nr:MULTISPECIES: fused MFS/spermidine synthase [Myroides]MTG97818.1 spermidine synthase [Myroides albus]MVX36829.1 spermidine synthase [Myroides sp. LoEW2-1]UVD79775.1 fused MFS/spermidine synthase [Myroides albus]